MTNWLVIAVNILLVNVSEELVPSTDTISAILFAFYVIDDSADVIRVPRLDVVDSTLDTREVIPVISVSVWVTLSRIVCVVELSYELIDDEISDCHTLLVIAFLF